MSFYSNFQSDKCPGAITGNPLNGLTEKVCIQVDKVFDAAIKQTQIENYTLTLTNLTPANPTYPLTFVSARSLVSEGTITNLSIDRQTEKSCARVQATVTIPVEVLYTDANGVEGTATASVSLVQDLLLFVPAPSIIPYNVRAVVSVVAPDATFDSVNNTFIASLCATVIIKIVMPVEILVPSYGYCAIPPAQEYSQEVCAGFFELPLYPQTNKPCHCNGNGKC
ncbi:MAG: hypothetical protein IJW58_00815 [Clostridia bacterium]|nr:hypothetical protein [Clostridia bacterium]